MSKKTTFVIPVRGGSRRIPRKNMLVLDGETLLARKIRQVLPLGKVVVGSDDDEMLEEASKHGAIAVRRNKTNEGQDSANDMIKEFMELIEPCDIVVWAHCTNPFISTSTYEKALGAFNKGLAEGYDSLVSVHEIRNHYWMQGKPLYDLDACRKRHICAAYLMPLYEQDGGIFVQSYGQMKKNSYFFGQKPKLFVIPDEEFCDINTPEDWVACQAIYAYRKGK